VINAANGSTPLKLGSPEINEFLSQLAVDRKVAGSIQNQALSALLFLYSKILKVDFQLDAVRSKIFERFISCPDMLMFRPR
jgi:hypothetical protein